MQIILAIAFLGIFTRLCYFQIFKHQELKSAVQRFHSKKKINIERADIVDRHGKVLALDMFKYSLEYNPVESDEDRAALAQNLGQIIELKNPDILYKHSSYTLARDLTKDQARQIRALNSRVLTLSKHTLRYYPQNFLASNILGYVDLYGQARQGIEAKFENLLKKHKGETLKLSIDSRLQALTEQALETRIQETKALRGTVVVMDTHTGELLAWATYPNYNPNKYFDFPIENTKNWSVTDVYQPGSIFKILTASSALDSLSIEPDYTFLDEGFLQVDRWKITNHDYNPKETKAERLNIQGLFQRSSNPFAAHIALTMGKDVFYDYIRNFGFGQKTNIEVPGESAGIVKKLSRWRNSDIAATGIGHGAISVTPLQLITAVNTIANRGLRVAPTLLKKENTSTNKKNKTLTEILRLSKKGDKNTIKQKGTRIVSNATARFVVDKLAGSIAANLDEKDSIAGRVPGLKVAGKTGTAEKIKSGGGYDHRRTVASFLGFFPAGNPKYTVLAVIDDPKTDGRWGDTVAGPLFNKVAGYVKNLYLRR